MTTAAAAIQAQWNLQAEIERQGRLDKRSSTHVYVIAEVGGFVKIGIAEDVHKRLCALQSSCPRELKLLASFLCSTRATARFLEKEAHAHFAAARLRGEWFKIGGDEAIAFLSASIARTRDNPTVK